VWSDNFTSAFITSPLPFALVSFVTIFVPDIEGIQNKVICFWIGTTCSVNVASTCRANLYDTSRHKPGADPGGVGDRSLKHTKVNLLFCTIRKTITFVM